ncbi:hypothetical protein SLA2020_261980 [Shorea laevis]
MILVKVVEAVHLARFCATRLTLRWIFEAVHEVAVQTSRCSIRLLAGGRLKRLGYEYFVEVSQITPSSQLSGQFSSDGIKSCDQLVLDYLQQPSSIGQEKGIHRDELCQQLKLPVDKIMVSIRALEEEGLIYSTIDEFHYKSTAYG